MDVLPTPDGGFCIVEANGSEYLIIIANRKRLAVFFSQLVSKVQQPMPRKMSTSLGLSGEQIVVGRYKGN